MMASGSNHTKVFERSPGQILLFLPNLIGYFRICLLIAAWRCISSDAPWVFLILYGLSVLLDGFDGWIARKFDQVSAFGAWLDVVIDNIGRQMVWSAVHPLGWALGCVEWLVFVCTHQLGPAWKSSPSDPIPSFVTITMSRGFKTPIGIFTIAGLHVLPIWLYVLQKNLLPSCLFIQMILLVLIAGRCWCLVIELFFISQHCQRLLEVDRRPKSTQLMKNASKLPQD